MIDGREFRKSGDNWQHVIECLPLVFAGCLVEDILLAVDREHTIFHDALPVCLLVLVSKQWSMKAYHLFLTRWTLSYMQSMT